MLLTKCRQDPNRFNSVILGRSAYWHRQVEIAESVVKYPTTLVPTGNAVGKTFLDAGILHWFLVSHQNSLVIATAPTQVQLEEVLWKEVERAYTGSRIPLGGRLLRQPLKVDFGGGWQALAYSTTTTERFSGHHAADLLAIVDEASGVEPAISEAIDSLNPSRRLDTGNPLRPDGYFYERCTRHWTQESEGKLDGLTNVIRIPSTESPDIHLPRSPRGLADATWLRKATNDYGEGSLWWLPHVDARFPDEASDTVIPRSWLDRCAVAEHFRGGTRRMPIDLAGGGGGDKAVLMPRDDNGVLALEHSNTWDLQATASKAALLAQRWQIDPAYISWDAEGLGTDFANRLEQVGLKGCRPYRGGNSGGKKFGNLRSAATWALRQRLDPNRRGSDGHALIAFAIRPDWLALMREELQGLRYALDKQGRICLEKKEDFKKRLRRSPDFSDALSQGFAWPNS